MTRTRTRSAASSRRVQLRIARAATKVRGDLTLVVLDAFMVVVAYIGLLMLRFDGSVPPRYWGRFLVFLPVALLVQLGANWLWGTYGSMWRHAGVDEARRLLLANGTSAIVLLSLFAWQGDPRVPLTVIVVGPLVCTILMGAPRFQSRLMAFRRARDRSAGLRIVVVGAGSAAASIIREMQRDTRLGLKPVAIVDDDPTLWSRSLARVPVVGGIDTLAKVVAERQAHQVLVAIPWAGPAVVRRVAAGARTAGVAVKTLPSVTDLVRDGVSLRDARDLRIDDLLGREQVKIDIGQVRALLGGRRVLVTGGGGSIGAEIARQVAAFEPARLVLLDRDETHLHDTAQELTFPAEQVLADVRDRRAVADVFRAAQPEVIFHAAAHKHVPILERYAGEAVAANVLGTLNVVEAAAACGSERLVAISTDKAAQPTGVMGASKWLSEQIVLARTPSGRRFCSVRFGNVLGSRGSVIPTFQRQIAAGGPLTVTDPRMTRYFMSLHEAVSLVLQAAARSTDSEVFMLEMGEPVNILELAQRMIRLSGERDDAIEIRITGPRPGEELEESLRAPGEQLEPTAHPSIHVVRPLRLDPDALDRALVELTALLELGDHELTRRLLLDVAAHPRAAATNGDDPYAWHPSAASRDA